MFWNEEAECMSKEKKEELSKEIEIYSNYENQLKDILKSLIERGAKFTWEN